MAQRKLHRGLQVAELAAAVEALAAIAIRQDLLFSEQALDGIGQLQLAASPGLHATQMIEDARRKDVAPDDAQVGRRFLGGGLFDNAVEPDQAVIPFTARHHAV